MTRFEQDEKHLKARISKLAISSLVLGILSLFLFILTGIPAIVVGIMSLLKIRRSGGALKGKYLALAGMNVSILFMCIFYILWSRDAPPIPNDYTLADLRSAPAEYAESFEILKTLIDEDWNIPGSPAIGLSDGDIDMIAEIRGVLKDGTTAEISQVLSNNSKDIKSAWIGTEKARDVVRRLNEFPEIADLTEPNARVRTLRYKNLIDLVRLFQVYAHLQTRQDDIRDFTTGFIELDSVCRKISLNARMLITKLICFMCIEDNIETANAIANNSAAPKESIESLAEHFKPLTKEQMSLLNPLLFQYLLTKNLSSEEFGKTKIGKTPLFKRNSTLRLHRNLSNVWIHTLEEIEDSNGSRLSVWPAVYQLREPVLTDAKKRLPLLYQCYNPVGSIFIQKMRVRQFGEKRSRRTMIRVRDDLLQIILNKKLGKEIDLKAHAFSDEYIVDIANKKIFSPGPDGKAGTKDDITLRINPEVLGWGD